LDFLLHVSEKNGFPRLTPTSNVQYSNVSIRFFTAFPLHRHLGTIHGKGCISDRTRVKTLELNWNLTIDGK